MVGISSLVGPGTRERTGHFTNRGVIGIHFIAHIAMRQACMRKCTGRLGNVTKQVLL